MTRLVLSIIAHNRLNLTRRCVTAVLASLSTYKDSWRLLLQDNASTDGVAEFFDDIKASNVHVAHYPKNTGFQIPTEAAFLIAKDAGAEFLVVVNNDCLPPINFLDVLQAEMERHPAAAIVGCQGGCSMVNGELNGYSGSSLQYVELACAMISVPKVAKHFQVLFGPEVAFAYGEDLLLSLKMQKLGYTIHAANFQIDHQRGSTSSIVPEAKGWEKKNHVALKEHWGHWIRTRTFAHRIVVRRWHSAGDVLLIGAVVRALWQQNPLCEIVVETMFSELFAGNPCVSGCGRDVGRHPNDLVIDLDMSSECGPMRHFITSYARTAGIDDPPHRTEFYAHLKEPHQLPEGRWCAIHTLTTWEGKNWKRENFAQLARQLREDGWKIVEVGATADYATAEPDLDLCGRTTPAQLGKVLSECGLFVGVDSFPMHLAGAVGTPVVGIYGITESRFILSGNGPQIGVDADPMLYPRAGERHRISGVTMVVEDGSTINSISVERVLEAARKLVPSPIAV